MKQAILFVDDDLNVLRGYERSLHNQRSQWDMYFALSGQEALSVLSIVPMDVIVTDIRMPGMDGAELLDIITSRFPNVIRIVLTGQSDQSTAIKTVQTAHQFLAKPCDATVLQQTIQRSCNLRDLLHGQKLIRTITGIGKLPSLPGQYLRLIQEIQSPDATLKVVGDIIARDMAMTAKVLQLVNSAFFSLPAKVTSPQRAATLLGINTLKALILYNKVFTEYQPRRSPSGFSMEELWRHSLMVGNLARMIMQSEGGDARMLDDVQVAGVLHDIGKIIELNISGFYDKHVNLVNRQKMPPLKAEYEILGVSHSELGAYLLGIWGLPTIIVEAVAFHHNPSNQPHTSFNPWLCLHIADWIIHEAAALESESQGHSLDTEFLEVNGLVGKMDSWRDLGVMVQRSFSSPAAMRRVENIAR